MTFRVRYLPHGNHVHCTLHVAAAPDRTYALCGEFVVRDGAEFEALQRCFAARFVEYAPKEPKKASSGS